ncbi:MAG: hypothetical protein JNL32_15535 [Candidatus Kapabacteria bacterium]|nr:hypothetical protein [Candidatus Kapabacteria bacterium]
MSIYSMRRSDDLFHLIKSLTKSEKRYFKLFSQQQSGDDKNYMVLFDKIEEQHEYNEELILKQFADKQFAKQLHVVKNYLYNLILKSMRVYNAGKTVDIKIQDAIRDADFLFDKGLYNQANKLLVKADELAREHEEHTLNLEVIRRIREVIRELDHDEVPAKLRMDLLTREKELLVLIDNVNAYKTLSATILYSLQTHGVYRTKEDWVAIDEIFANPLLHDESRALTYLSKKYLFHIRGAYYSAKYDYQNAYEASKKLIETFESWIERNKEEVVDYIYALTNHLIDCFNCQRFDEFLAGVEKIKKIIAEHDTPSLNFELQVFKTTSNLELTYYMQTAQFDKGIALAVDVEATMKKYKDYLDSPNQIILAYNLALLYFYVGRYDQSLRWANVIINDTNELAREDVYCFARIMSLLLHFELGNVDLLEHILKSTLRYLSKRNRLYKVESLVMNYIKKFRVAKDDTQLKSNFKQMLEEALELEQDPYERSAYSYLDLISWLQHKIENKPMEEFIRSRITPVV